MAKICLNGEWFDFDQDHRPMSEALALEAAYGAPHGQWERELAAGSARALCAFCWLVWRRNGRDVPLADILSGEFEVDRKALFDSLRAAETETAEDGPVPTGGPAAGQDPDGTPTTPASSSRSSRRSTTSGPGRSGS